MWYTSHKCASVVNHDDDSFNTLYTSFLVVCFQQIRMRIKTIRAVQTTSSILFTLVSLWYTFHKCASVVKHDDDSFNTLYTSFLVVCFQQIRMRIETIRAVQTTSSILFTLVSLWYFFNKYLYTSS